jgi:putative chitinase
MPDQRVKPVNQAMLDYDIVSVKRVACFLGLIAHESSDFNRIEENLSYSPQRIVAVWPSRFESLQDALPYARNPEKLANFVYADRLGNEAYGDGYNFRGRGLIQITGRANYQLIADLLDVPSLVHLPNYLLEPRYAAMSAAAWWRHKGLNKIAEDMTGDTVSETVVALTNVINGDDGNDFDDGFDERLAYTRRALAILDTEFEV